MQYQSIFLQPEKGKHRLHIKRINKNNSGIPILMIHGMVENGRIFYHQSGKGLGSYLAQQGYDVFVADLRGIGLSEPRISRDSEHGQTETVCEDVPALIEFVLQATGQNKVHLAAHSWGGVYLNAALARRPDLIQHIGAAVYFGSKRRVRVKNLDRLIKIDLAWDIASNLFSKILGYVDAKKLRFGSDNETRKSNRQVVAWVRQDKWIDADDGFDYHQALNNISLPAIWYIAAIDDHSLGHRDDVQRFMQECGDHEQRYTVLSKQNGNALDYGHVTMLTSPKAVQDYFPLLLEWFQRYEVDWAGL